MTQSKYTIAINKIHDDGGIEPMTEYPEQELDEGLVKLRKWLRLAPVGAAFDLTITKDEEATP